MQDKNYFCKKAAVYSTNKSFKTLSDLELVERYALTDEKLCVGILFERYSTLVYAVCLKYFQDRDESKDAAMQVFEKILVDLKKHSITNFKSWLHSVAKNYCSCDSCTGNLFR